MTAIVTSWSDFCKELNAAPKRLKRKELNRWILRQLSGRPKQRFSVFEASEEMHVAKALTRLCRQGFIETIHDERDIFPWTYYKIHQHRTLPRPAKPIRCKSQLEVFLEVESV